MNTTAVIAGTVVPVAAILLIWALTHCWPLGWKRRYAANEILSGSRFHLAWSLKLPILTTGYDFRQAYTLRTTNQLKIPVPFKGVLCVHLSRAVATPNAHCRTFLHACIVPRRVAVKRYSLHGPAYAAAVSRYRFVVRWK